MRFKLPKAKTEEVQSPGYENDELEESKDGIGTPGVGESGSHSFFKVSDESGKYHSKIMKYISKGTRWGRQRLRSSSDSTAAQSQCSEEECKEGTNLDDSLFDFRDDDDTDESDEEDDGNEINEEVLQEKEATLVSDLRDQPNKGKADQASEPEEPKSSRFGEKVFRTRVKRATSLKEKRATAESELDRTYLHVIFGSTLMLSLVVIGAAPDSVGNLTPTIFWIATFGALYLYFPVILGWILSKSVTEFALFGYPFRVGSLHISPWIHDGKLQLRLYAQKIGFANPKGFPHKWFVHCGRVDMVFAIPLSKIPGLLLLQRRKVPLKKDPDFSCFAVLEVPYIDFDTLSVNFELCDGKFNINQLTKEIAEREVAHYLKKEEWKVRARAFLRPGTIKAKLKVFLLTRLKGFREGVNWRNWIHLQTWKSLIEVAVQRISAFFRPDKESQMANQEPETPKSKQERLKKPWSLVRTMSGDRSSVVAGVSKLDTVLNISNSFKFLRRTSDQVRRLSRKSEIPSVREEDEELDELSGYKDGGEGEDEEPEMARALRARSYSCGDMMAASSTLASFEPPLVAAKDDTDLLLLQNSMLAREEECGTFCKAFSSRKMNMENIRRSLKKRFAMSPRRKPISLPSFPLGFKRNSTSPSSPNSPQSAASESTQPKGMRFLDKMTRRSLKEGSEESLNQKRKSGHEGVKTPAQTKEGKTDQMQEMFPSPNRLEISIIRAKDLQKKDKNIFTGGTIDPKVVIKLREQQGVTFTRYNTCKPMWNEKFYFHVSDPSTVLHISVMDEDFTNDDFLGQWILTLKYMVLDPKYCYFIEEGFEVVRSAPNDITIKGWFPLKNRKWQGLGNCGSIEMVIRWRFDPHLPAEFSPPPRSALVNLDSNSRETQLRLGDKEKVIAMLNRVPVLFNIHRVTIHSTHFYLQDLFRGTTGHAEVLRRRGKSSDEANKIKIKSLEWKTSFRPRKNEPGITVYQVLYSFFITGLIPKVFNQNILSSALSQTATGFAFNLIATAGSLLRGETALIKLLPTKMPLTQQLRTVARHVKKKLQGDQDGSRVNAEDEEFLLDSIHEGFLEKVSVSKRADLLKVSSMHFRCCFFQLKGRSLFYTPVDGVQPRKILIQEIQLISLDRKNQYIYIHRHEKVTVLRFGAVEGRDTSQPASRFQQTLHPIVTVSNPKEEFQEESLDNDLLIETSSMPSDLFEGRPRQNTEEEDQLLRWFDELRAVGVNHTILN